MHLEEATWPEADATDATIALLPVGSTEQHGPHASLATDTIAAEAIASAGADAAGEPAVVAPAVPYGISEEHRSFAGTLWLSPDTFRSVVGDLIESATHHGYDRVVLVNGHGGNAAALREVAASLSRDGAAQVAAFTWFDAIDDEDLGHAGPIETSLLLHVAPERVDTEAIEAPTAGAETWGEWVSGTNLAYDSDSFTENGVVGDPSEASEARGKELLETAGQALADLIEAVAERGAPSTE